MMIICEVSLGRMKGQSFSVHSCLVSSALCLAFKLVAFALNAPTLQGAPSGEGQDLLVKADQQAFHYSWANAGLLYEQAETKFIETGDLPNALYARVSRIRSRMEYEPLTPLIEELQTVLASPSVKNDTRLLLRTLIVKAELESQYSLGAAAQTWERVRNLTQQLNLQVMDLRAQAELAVIAFQVGDIEKVVNTRSVLIAMHEARDVDAEVRYISTAAMGLCETGRCEEALVFLDRALAMHEANPNGGFPFIAYFGKSIALAALQNSSEAQQILERCLAQARLENSRLQEAIALYLLGKLYREQDSWGAAEECLEKAVSIAGAMDYRWNLALSELETAELMRQRGKLEQATQHLAAGLQAKSRFGDQIHSPTFLAAQARLKASQRDFTGGYSIFTSRTRA